VTRHHRIHHGLASDAGAAATLFVLGFAVMLMGVAGLVVDGGLAINARERIADDAEQAARAGAQHIDEAALRADGTLRLASTEARQAARVFLTDQGYSPGDVMVIDNGVEITVRVERQEPTALLQLIGISDFDVAAEASAAAESGIETGDWP
jgi:Flp pilus assembly protein TadG